MILKKVRGMTVAFPSAEVMNAILKDAGVRPEEVEDVELKEDK
ncbi:MAG: hypothetical protein ACP5HQ_08420 [Thermoprotei archaeon]